MAEETVETIVKQVAAGTMAAAEAGRKIKVLVTRVAPLPDEAERMKRYYEGHHEAAIETDPNSFLHVEALFVAGKLSMEQVKAIQTALHSTQLSEGTEYFLTDGDPPHPVRKQGEDIAEVFDSNGKWNRSTTRDAQARMTGDLVNCTEQEALDAAKKVMG